MEEALKDERFSHIISDPRFRKMPKHVRKVTLDKRMKNIFKDSSFKGNCELDKRGRLLNLTPTENLKKLYDMSSESTDDEEEGEEDTDENNIMNEKESKPSENSRKKADSVIRKSSKKDTSDESDGSDNSETSDNMEDQVNKTLKGHLHAEDSEKSKKANVEKSSSEESDDSDSESDDSSGNQSEDFDHKWEELRNEAPDTNEIYRRLAVCNMDWDRIRALDLLVCFDSFKPSDGCINCVKIYPSEYGLKRMEEEKLKGPCELVEKTLNEELQDKGSKYHREKLRMYQINRLKYYYAVVDCDSPETANVLYEQLNGMEYESSSIRFDLRFIPDDVTFDHEPTSTADKLPDPTEYKPRLFVTSALQQVKVDLTWDETNPKRREFFQKIFSDPDSVQNDIRDFIASASSESEVEEESIVGEEPNESMKTKDRIAKYKDLLLSIEEKEKAELEGKHKYDIEVTWEVDVKKNAEEQIQEKIKRSNLNPFEEMLHKKKEERKKKRKEQKAMHEQARDSDDSEEECFGDTSTSNEKTKDEKRLAELALISDSKKEINFEEKSRRKNKKNKSRDLDDFVGNPNDPRFAAMYKSSLFNMVPSNPPVKKNDGKHIGKSEKRKFKSKKFNESFKKAKY